MIKYVLGTCLALCFVAVVCVDNGPVNQQCLKCICEAISGCKTTDVCSGDVCGPFRITWAYWSDSGKPTLEGESADAPQAYDHCALDNDCSARSVQGYLSKFQQDCNGDKRIDCDDFAAIHTLGGYGCRGDLPVPYGRKYKQCKNFVEGSQNSE